MHEDNLIIPIFIIIVLLLLIPVLIFIQPTVYKEEKTEIATFNNLDTFDYDLIKDYDLILAIWTTPDNTPIEHFTVIFTPDMLTLGNCFITQIQNNPVRLGCLNHTIEGTIRVGVINNVNNIDTSFIATVKLIGIKTITL